MSELLVSVKNKSEAIIALEAGTDILDIKDPNNGSLGMANAATIQSIINLIPLDYPVKTSIALGELDDWPKKENSITAPIPHYLNEATFLKVGPGQSKNLNHWFDNLLDFVLDFRQAGIDRPAWIAVLYAENLQETLFKESTNSQIDQLALNLNENDFAGLLIDTGNKSEGNLCSHVNIEQLKLITKSLKSQNLLCSLAGRLSIEDIGNLIEQKITPDYYAVRSAVCSKNNRQLKIKQSKVQELKNLLTNRRVFCADRIH